MEDMSRVRTWICLVDSWKSIWLHDTVILSVGIDLGVTKLYRKI